MKHLKTYRTDQTLDRWFDTCSSNVIASRQNGKYLSLTADWILPSARPRKYTFFSPEAHSCVNETLSYSPMSFWSINLKSEENC
jgi:hypothetical protein